MDDDEAFTYAALRRIERQENTSPRLVRLEGRFWEQLGEHLATLRRAFQDQQEEDPTSRRTVVLADELRNTQRLAESIWSLREKKVAHAALAAIRRRDGRGEVPENVTPEERALFERVLQVFKATRDEAGITDPFSRRRAERAADAAEAAAVAARAGAAAPPGGAPADSSMPATSRPSTPGATTGQGPSPPVATASATAQGVPSRAEGHPQPGPSRASPEGAPDGKSPVEFDPGHAGRRTPEQEGGSGRPAAAAEAGRQARQEAQDQGGGGMGAAGQLEMELWLVQALADVPKFAGPDLNDYQLAKGEIGNLPRNAAELLQKKGKVRILPGA